MNVKIMKPYGFCAGVEYVINMLHKVIEEHKGQKIYCFGQIVHNNRVNEEINSLGVIILQGDKEKLIDEIENGAVENKNQNLNTNNTNENLPTTTPHTGIGDYSSTVFILVFAASAVYAYKKIKDYNV